MIHRRDFLRALVAAGGAGIAGCNTFLDSESDQDPQERTQTTVLTPTPTMTTETRTPTGSPTETRPDTETATSTATPTPTPPTTPTVAEQVGTPVYRPNNGVDEFGQAVALAADTAIVVAEEYGAYVFEAGSDGWTNTTVLVPADREDFGGHAVSATLVGEKAVIGGPEAEAAYLFERADDEWVQRHRFDPDTTRAEFGRSVAFGGDRVVVGDAHDPTTMVPYVGGAHVFTRDDSGWIREASLTTDTDDLFGTAVAVDGETVLVGAPFATPEESQTGAVYVYERMDESWERQGVLSPADPTDVVSDGRFGQAVALDGSTAIVGAPEIPRGAGRAYVFRRTNTGWSQKARLTAPDISDGAEFGRSVALVDGTVIVGAPQTHEVGRAYVFTASDAWTDPLWLAAANPHEDTEFGAAVALSGTTALVGAPVFRAASGAYLFEF